MDTLQQLFEKNKYDRDTALMSRNWFRQQSKLLAGVTSNQVLIEGGKQSRSIIPGSMYAYYYSPKYRDTLPYYDVFPLVIPYAMTDNGFIGLNLHYLPPYFRVRLLDRLMIFATSETLSANTKIKYSWALIQRAAAQKWASQCIHRYITGYVKSRFVKIHPKDWYNICMLPVQQFRKQSAQTVWSTYS